MPRRKTPRFEIVKTKLPARPRRLIPGGRWHSGPHRRNPDRAPIEKPATGDRSSSGDAGEWDELDLGDDFDLWR